MWGPRVPQSPNSDTTALDNNPSDILADCFLKKRVGLARGRHRCFIYSNYPFIYDNDRRHLVFYAFNYDNERRNSVFHAFIYDNERRNSVFCAFIYDNERRNSVFRAFIYDNERRNSVFRAFNYSDRPRLSVFSPSIWADCFLKNSVAHRKHGKNENAIALVPKSNSMLMDSYLIFEIYVGCVSDSVTHL
ncbi:hypothetical protein H6G04_02380 [Calothrix membranacea FACHB-236]|nr:hypothetical protein [Calothrix membranacea FACHB-236]